MYCIGKVSTARVASSIDSVDSSDMLEELFDTSDGVVVPQVDNERTLDVSRTSANAGSLSKGVGDAQGLPANDPNL